MFVLIEKTNYLVKMNITLDTSICDTHVELFDVSNVTNITKTSNLNMIDLIIILLLVMRQQ
jgi:hypothetical protein